jgi:hypothetical protein
MGVLKRGVVDLEVAHIPLEISPVRFYENLVR